MSVEGKTVRPDMLIWCPANPSIKLIVECDGYGYHSSRAAFTADRKRDRALLGMGYQIMRISGSEINNEPGSVAFELTQYLWGLQ